MSYTRTRILTLLEDDVFLTRKEIAEHLGISIDMIERYVNSLRLEGRLVARPAYVPAGCPGRPPLEFSLNKEYKDAQHLNAGA